MARNVVISTIGGPYLQVDGSLPHSEMWEKIQKHLTAQMAQVAPDKPDLAVFTEMCDLPFPSSYKSAFALPFAKERGTDNLRFFSRMAKENKCNVSFCTVAQGRGNYQTNTIFIMDRNGNLAGQYDKYYVTGGENDGGTIYGEGTPVFNLDIGRVACAICFDLNFDDLRDMYVDLKPELIIFSSQFHGGLLQQMWANKIRAYFVGSIAHQRPSAILNPLGETVAYSTDYLNYATARVNLDYALVHLKEKAAVDAMKLKYGAGVTFYDPCYLGYFMLINEMPNKTIGDLLAEFDVTTYDDYLVQSRAQRMRPGNRGASAVPVW